MDTLPVQGGLKEKKYKSLQKKVESVSPLFTPSDEKEREGTRVRLIRAGYHHESAISYFYAIKIGIMLIGLFGASVYYLYSGTEQNIFVIGAAGAAIGMFLPNIALDKMVANRQKNIKRGVPDALDLLVVCTESGLGLNMALSRVSKELSVSHPDLAEELEVVCAKINSGYEMPLAFRDLVERTGVTELTGLVSMLSHAAKLGGSIAQTLRDYTEDYRDKRNQELEEIAAKIPTKMIFPMIVFIWPSFFIVVVGPAALALADAFKAMSN
ncbi:COG2064 Flp pilus assembly protein TadC [Vibrio sp. B1FLJ16]|uniref:type II secretion system F family protein n=1 Tax=Vibrio sp. B1FLJ16 TaxID=2751178 RepID=UPI001AFCB965|nr:COG2064 Flp pilus assembly protein TadC [Vibrio sp. B1FLJ16]CAE6914907.1 COG2064 Flp pilus assembly protein TadC [Vibrio sp. B1FLJ16]